MRHPALSRAGVAVLLGTLLITTSVCFAQKDGKQKANPIDFNQLVLSLANKNPAPKLMGNIPDQWPLFAKDYDWEEQRRVLKVIQALIDAGEAALPAMAEHLDDTRYCVTFRYDEGGGNVSVGNLCRTILEETLMAAQRPHIPHNEIAFARLETPDAFRNNLMAKDWCQKQFAKKRPLYELQMEMCNWAIDKLPSLPEVSVEEKLDAVRGMQGVIETLRTTRQPVLMKTIFLRESRGVYSAEWAEESRKPDSIQWTVSGKIQQDSFRAFLLKRCAIELNLAGWVKNNDNGSVSFLFQGDGDRTALVLDRISEGRKPGEVREISTSGTSFDPELKTFTVYGWTSKSRKLERPYNLVFTLRKDNDTVNKQKAREVFDQILQKTLEPADLAKLRPEDLE